MTHVLFKLVARRAEHVSISCTYLFLAKFLHTYSKGLIKNVKNIMGNKSKEEEAKDDVRKDYWEILRAGKKREDQGGGQHSSDDEDARQRKERLHEAHRKKLDEERDRRLERQTLETLKQTKKISHEKAVQL
ncbi:unnamed protein product [Amoebophrya sp. A120]|nr:unnamed protein product [Amoebophrya sp. A120]|eukprot:GSA120T00015407001.1